MSTDGYSDIHYEAAGGVVVNDGRVLVLRRPDRNEIRLPKGHIESGEKPEVAALREVREESGYEGACIVADLGVRVVEFDHQGRHWVRNEHYFLMTLRNPAQIPASGGEAQFQPAWLAWPEAVALLTYEFEREWVRRAQQAMPAGSTD